MEHVDDPMPSGEGSPAPPPAPAIPSLPPPVARSSSTPEAAQGGGKPPLPPRSPSARKEAGSPALSMRDLETASHQDTLVVGRQLVRGVRTVAGLLMVGILAILSFHPWVRQGVELASSILPMMVLVLIFTYVVSPVVEFVHRWTHRLGRSAALSHDRSLGLTFFILAGGMAILAALLLPPLVGEARTLATSLPGYSQTMRLHLVQYQERYSNVVPPALQERIREATSEIGRLAGTLLQQGVAYAGTVSQAVLWFVGCAIMVPLLGYYFLKDHEGILGFLLRCVEQRRRPRVMAVLGDLHVAMQGFIKGQVILCLAIFALTYVCMLFVLPSYAIGLAVVAGICEAIPVVGPILGSVPAIIIAFAASGPTTALVVAGIYLAIQQTENMVLVPRVMGESLGLHPLSLTLGMIVFGNVLGFWGVLLAAPLCATAKILVLHFLVKDEAAQPGPCNDAG